jgi:hypothetical protein
MFGYRGGWGFGFRGSSPPWPYVGRGRGGLPRCSYFFGAPNVQVAPQYAPYYGASWGMPYGTTPFAPQMTREQELDFLRSEAEAVKEQLEKIESRIGELETEGS